MSKQYPLLLGILVLGLTGCAVSTPIARDPASAPVAQQPAPQSETPRTIIGLLQRGGNYSCAFTEELPTQKTIGWVYISGERASGGATLFPSDARASSNTTFIRNADFTYVWANTLTNAPKTGVKRASVSIENTRMPSGSSVDFSHETTFTCAPWAAVDERVFLPPATVSFTGAN